MADDLNDFLRQAALRREARKRAEAQGGQASKSASPQPQPPRSRSSEPQTPVRSVLTSHPNSGESAIERDDRQREAHRQQVFGDKKAPLQKAQPQPPKSKNKPPQPSKSKPTAQPSSRPMNQSTPPAAPSFGTEQVPGSVTSDVISPSDDLLKLLRNPQTLKTAFIASEIFARKFE